jgi:hypothetical protein
MLSQSAVFGAGALSKIQHIFYFLGGMADFHQAKLRKLKCAIDPQEEANELVEEKMKRFRLL